MSGNIEGLQIWHIPTGSQVELNCIYVFPLRLSLRKRQCLSEKALIHKILNQIQNYKILNQPDPLDPSSSL